MSTTRRPYAGPRTLAVIRFVLLGTAVVALLAGPAWWVNGLTQRSAAVHVPVHHVVAQDADAPTGLDSLSGTIDLPLPPALADHGVDAQPSAVLTTGNDDLDLAVWDSTYPEWMLARGDDLVRALAVGVGALLLRRVVGSVGQGRPFARGNAARIAGVAAAVAVAGFVAPLLPPMAAELVLARLGVQGPGGPLQPSSGLDLAPLLLVGLLLALAEAFRHGERLARETDGLV